jgi:glycopeptide antibiotics resistance protein
MGPKMCVLFHFLIFLVFSVGVFSRRRLSMIILLFLLPVLGEGAQYYMPSRTGDPIDVVHGYLGILVGFCLVQMWREVNPTVKKIRLHLNKKVA